jgi:hypothetical protein
MGVEEDFVEQQEVTGEARQLSIGKRHDLYFSEDVIRLIKSRRLRWAGSVACPGERRDAYGSFDGKV